MKKTKVAIKSGIDEDMVDRISELCDEILISIISRLSLREATTTSILSSRWRHLYIYTSRLDFPPCEPHIEPYIEKPHLFRVGEPLPKNANYMSLINSIFDSHEVCRVLKQFKIHMPFMEGANIERWLEFALTRKVEIIDISILGLHLLYSNRDVRHDYFTLGLSNLIKKKGLQPLLHDLKFVKKISLDNIQVDDEEVGFLVSNSPGLESLSLSHSLRLRNVLIAAPHSPLSHLYISHSYYIEYIQVRDMINLVTLRCHKLPRLRILKLNNLPKLAKFSATGSNMNYRITT